MTIFEKIINRELPAKIEYEDDEIIVIHDLYPKAKVHLLIIPKKLITTVSLMEELDIKIMGKLFFVSKLLAKKLNIEGYRLQCNVGEKGGQEIFHVHLHFLAN
jgi:histidine triad (HIT) family protein